MSASPRTLLASLLATTLLLAACACSRTPEEPNRPSTSETPAPTTAPAPAKKQTSCPADPEGGPPMLPVHTLTVRENNVQFACELVYKPDDTQRGLMYRTHLADDRGMLFKLPRRIQRFWMHNTCISLDMLFVDEDGTIVGILEKVPPLNDESRSIGKPTTYVLELAAGAASRFGVQAGQHLDLPATIRELAVAED